MNGSPTHDVSWWRALAVYADRRVLAILLLGFSSGLPLALTFSTLSVWLFEAGVDKTTIGLFALAGLPYTFKFLWSPLIDGFRLPFLSERLGRRRGWLVVIQAALVLAILALGRADPTLDPWNTALWTLTVAFFSASQDIVIDAYRVEVLEPRQYGAGAAMIVLGYRLGMLASGAGALYLSTWFGWFVTYAIMAALLPLGLIGTLLCREPPAPVQPPVNQGDPVQRMAAWTQRAVVAPFAEFMTRPRWYTLLLFILLFKMGDALAGIMSNPFYLELGFTSIDIANVTKLFGMGATILGGVIGGVLVSRLGIHHALLICGILQMASNLVFVGLALVEKNMVGLILAVGVENLSGGMGSAAFVAYLSLLCHQTFTATQYALLSSLAAMGRTILSAPAGWLAEQLSWVFFFILTTVAALPGLILLLYILRRFPAKNSVN